MPSCASGSGSSKGAGARAEGWAQATSVRAYTTLAPRDARYSEVRTGTQTHRFSLVRPLTCTFGRPYKAKVGGSSPSAPTREWSLERRISRRGSMDPATRLHAWTREGVHVVRYGRLCCRRARDTPGAFPGPRSRLVLRAVRSSRRRAFTGLSGSSPVIAARQRT